MTVTLLLGKFRGCDVGKNTYRTNTMSAPPSPLKGLVDGIGGFLNTTTKMAVGVVASPVKGIVGAFNPEQAAVSTIVDVEREWSKPFVGSPTRGAKVRDDETDEFSDVNFWSMPKPDLVVEEDTPEFADVNYWKTPMPTLEELEKRGGR